MLDRLGFLKYFRQARLPTDYEQQTHASPYWIVRYPHQRRIRLASDLLVSSKPDVVLDYGAGDGRLLIDAVERGLSSTTIIAYEPVPEMAERLSSNIRDSAVARGRIEVHLNRGELPTEIDFVACLEVLEHMPLPERQAFYEICQTRLRRDGRALVEVPVEVGPTLLVKAIGRLLLKGRRREYSGSELLKYALGSRSFDPARFDPTHRGTWIHDHKGFDYRLLTAELSARMDIVERHSSPMPLLPPPFFNQTVFLLAAPKSIEGVDMAKA